MKIGIFDSGIGGVTVLHEATKLLPNEDYIYYADTKNVPYGVKPKNIVKEYILEAVDFMMQQEVKIIVIACNTATSIAIEELRSIYSIPILGMEPAVKPAVEKSITINKRVLVTGTPLTIKEEKLKNLITRLDNEAIVDLIALPKLVDFAENQQFEGPEVVDYLTDALSSYKLEQYGTIVLGCTHFPYFKNIFEGIVPKGIDIIDGNNGTVKNLKRIIDTIRVEDWDKDKRKGTITYYKSGSVVTKKEEMDTFKSLHKRLDAINI
jgi:glutamate racemase